MAILKLAVPCIVSMLVTTFYNMADTFFVGMLKSNAATGAVGVVFSMMTIIQAVGFFFGHGSGNYISRQRAARTMTRPPKWPPPAFLRSDGRSAHLHPGRSSCGPWHGSAPRRPFSLHGGYTAGHSDRRALDDRFPSAEQSAALSGQRRCYAMVGITAGAVL